MGSQIVSLEQLAEALNYPEEEIMDMVMKSQIIFFHTVKTDKDGGKFEEYSFPLEEVLAKIKPRPAKVKKAEPSEAQPIPVAGETEPVAPKRGRKKKV